MISRKPNEKIRLSNGITISVEGIESGKVRIGIEAPHYVCVTRSDACKSCKRPSFDYYLGYKDIPFCGHLECEQWIKDNDKSLFK